MSARRERAYAMARHIEGVLTPGERLEGLFDDGSAGLLSGSGQSSGAVLAANGRVDGRPVLAAACGGGEEGRATAADLASLTGAIASAASSGSPLVLILDAMRSPADAETSIGAASEVLARLSSLDGRSPRIAVIAGACEGFTALLAGLCDFRFMVAEVGSLAVSSPAILEAVSDRAADHASLGGEAVHSASGLLDGVFTSEIEALLQVRQVLACLSGTSKDLGIADAAERVGPTLDTLVPADPLQVYDCRELLDQIFDDGSFAELQPMFGPSVIAGFGKLAGVPLGIVACQPKNFAGALGAAACRKATRLVRLCDRFGLPAVTFVDSPGFLADPAEERDGLAGAAAEVLAAYANHTGPRAWVVLRYALGAIPAVLGFSTGIAGPRLAWPSAEIAMSRLGNGKGELPAGLGRVEAIAPRDTRRHLATWLAGGP